MNKKILTIILLLLLFYLVFFTKSYEGMTDISEEISWSAWWEGEDDLCKTTALTGKCISNKRDEYGVLLDIRENQPSDKDFNLECPVSCEEVKDLLEEEYKKLAIGEGKMCFDWAERGLCDVNSLYMKRECSGACDFISDKFGWEKINQLTPETIVGASVASPISCITLDTDFFLEEEIDLRKPLEKTFHNLSMGNCVIPFERLIEYGFTRNILELVFGGAPRGALIQEDITFENIKGYAEKAFNCCSQPQSAARGREFAREVYTNAMCLIYCLLALGNKSLNKNTFREILSEWASIHYILKPVFGIIPDKMIDSLFNILSDNKVTIPDFESFLDTEIRKSTVDLIIDENTNDISTSIENFHKLGLLALNGDPLEELFKTVDSLFMGKRSIMIREIIEELVKGIPMDPKEIEVDDTLYESDPASALASIALGPVMDQADATVDCVGAYSEFGACSVDCGGGTQSRTYNVSTPASNGGVECLDIDPRWLIRPCNVQECPGE